MAQYLAAVEELARLWIVELLGGALLKGALFMKAANDLAGHALVDVHGGFKGAAGVQVAGHAKARQVGLLAIVVLAHVVRDMLFVAVCLATLAEALHDGGAVAVRAGDEDDVLSAQAVAQEAGIEIRGDKDAAHVAKVKALVAVGHAGGDDGAARPAGSLVAAKFMCHERLLCKNAHRPRPACAGLWAIGWFVVRNPTLSHMRGGKLVCLVV